MVVKYKIVSYDKQNIFCCRKGPNDSEEVPIAQPHYPTEFSTTQGFITYKGLLHALMEDMNKQTEQIEIEYDRYLNSPGMFDDFSSSPIDSLVGMVNELISLRNSNSKK